MTGAADMAVRTALNLLVARYAASAPLPAFPSRVLIADIVARVAWESGLDGTDIIGRSRMAHVSRARWAVIWLARAFGNSTVKIGHALDRDHSSIVDAARRADFFRDNDVDFRRMTDRLLTHFHDLQEN